jgi:hypothetical protein
MSSHDFSIVLQSVIACYPSGQSSDQRKIFQEWYAPDHALGFRLKLTADVAKADLFCAFQSNPFQVEALSRLDIVEDFQIRSSAFGWLATRFNGCEKVPVLL